jgi:hypothetical protein
MAAGCIDVHVGYFAIHSDSPIDNGYPVHASGIAVTRCISDHVGFLLNGTYTQ